MKNLAASLLLLCLAIPANAWLITPDSRDSDDNDDCRAASLSDADRALLRSTHASCEAAASTAASANATCSANCVTGEPHNGCASVADVSALLHRTFYIKCRETSHGIKCAKPGHRLRLTPVDP